MAFFEDMVPQCRCTAHPAHTDKRRWMVAIREEADYVVWCCRRCTEIAHVPTIQVQMLARGWAMARHANQLAGREKQRLLGDGRKGTVRVTE